MANIHWSPMDGESIASRTLLRGGERIKITSGDGWDGLLVAAESPTEVDSSVYVVDLKPVDKGLGLWLGLGPWKRSPSASGCTR